MNGNLSRDDLVRPIALESNKKLIHPGAFFLSRTNYQKLTYYVFKIVDKRGDNKW